VSREGAAISAHGELIEGVYLVFRNSMVIAEGTEPACAVYWGALGGNLDSDGSCNLTDPTDLPNSDPLLGPLQDNGGPTPTHALLPGSPAIDAIPHADCTYDDDGNPATPEVPLATDQRGVARPQWIGCDIGAFEAFVNAGCGLGAELALVLPLLAISRRRLR